MKVTTKAAFALACVASLAACDAPVEQFPPDRADSKTMACSTSFTTEYYPELGIVRQQEACNRSSAGAFVQWDFQNTLQVCPGFSDWISGGGGVGMGSCKSVFDESVNQEQRDVLLEALNNTRAHRSLPAITLTPGR